MAKVLSKLIAHAVSKSISRTLVMSQVFYFHASAETPRYRYVTIRGDSLSDIILAVVPGRLYGPSGNLKRVEKLNPNILNPNRLIPGDIVFLPDGSRYLFKIEDQKKTESIHPNFRDESAVNNRITELKDWLPQKRTIASSDITSEQKSESISLIKEETIDPTIKDSPSFSKNNFLRGAKLELSPFYFMNAITLTDPTNETKSTIGSKIYSGANLRYFQSWTNSFQSYVHLNLGFIAFEPPTDVTKSLSNSNLLISGMGIGASYRLLNPLEIDFSAMYQKELFGRSASTTSLSIDSVAIPSLHLKLSWDIFNLNPFIFGVASTHHLYFATQDTVNPVEQGSGIGGIIYLKQFLGGNMPDFQTDIGILSRSQSSAQIEQNEILLSLNVRFYFDIGKQQKPSFGME